MSDTTTGRDRSPGPAPATPVRGARRPTIAIDGPAGAGKSSIARRLAERLALPHVDTGAMYRAVTLAVLRAGAEPTDGETCSRIARDVDLSQADGRTLLDGEDVEDAIRGADVTAAVSAVSAHAGVREALVPHQRRAAADGGVIEGRDIGTAVLPDADLKVYLTASLEERARRRALQEGTDPGPAVERELERRDRVDSGRDVSPLAVAPDAWVLDTTDLGPAEVVEAIAARVAATADDDPLTRRSGLPRVVVVGRPNVGKSTLVNRILGRRVAIVEERPGVTRDRTEHETSWLGRRFVVVDTGGWVHEADGLDRLVVDQAESAIADADVALLVVDARVGPQEDDERFARLLRRLAVESVVVANKVDADAHEPAVHEFHGLGLGDPLPVSARHGRGVGDLLDRVTDGFPDVAVEVDDLAIPRVAVVGRPNVGKSSLYNRLVGADRAIVHADPHTTRDAIDSLVRIDDEPWIFVDTAGMRRRYRHGEDTELYAVDRTRAAIEHAHLVLFVVDASQPLGEQDQRLAALVRDAGRGIVLVCNKWDLVDEDRRGQLERELDRLLGFASWVPRVNVSALTGRGTRRVVPRLRAVWERYRRRIPTPELNRMIDAFVREVPPPLGAGRRPLRLRYATQVEVAPPLFVVFANGPIPESYRRYLERRLRETVDLEGVPVTIRTRRPRRDR